MVWHQFAECHHHSRAVSGGKFRARTLAVVRRGKRIGPAGGFGVSVVMRPGSPLKRARVRGGV